MPNQKVFFRVSLAERYQAFFEGSQFQFVLEPAGCRSNYWLNAVICENLAQRDELLAFSNQAGVMTRPIWKLMSHLPAYSSSLKGDLTNALWLEERVVNLPSSVVPELQV
ncbi:DegT/DnrJ/EryC1/StrS family aminotransferase [Pseudomonas veronii]